MSLVKWVAEYYEQAEQVPRDRIGETVETKPIAVVPLADLTEVVEGLKANIAHSFINTDEISAYRLACEHLLTQLEAHRKEGA